MPDLLVFLIILGIGLLLSLIFERLHLPYVSALIVAGLLIGPSGLDLVEIDDTLQFLSEMGILFLMFTAGSESTLSDLRQFGRDIVIVAVVSAGIPFLVGFIVGLLLSNSLIVALVLAVVFMTSSIVVVQPTLTNLGLQKSKLGQVILGSSVVQDMASLFVLALILQGVSPNSGVPVWIYGVSVLLILIFAKWGLPQLKRLMQSLNLTKNELFQDDLRLVIVLMLAAVVLAELIGIHGLISAFAVGLFLNDVVSAEIKTKFKVISYGVFVPIFFLVTGMQLELAALGSVVNLATAVIIIASAVFSSFASGYLAANLVNFQPAQSLVYASATTIKLTTTLAIAFTINNLEIAPSLFGSILILLSLVTTLVGPVFLRLFGSNLNNYQKRQNFPTLEAN